MKSDYAYSSQYPVRLTQKDIEVILTAFKKTFGSDDHLWLFGSRVDLNKRGGDIDLYVETHFNVEDAAEAELKFLHELYEGIGEQKIDIILSMQGKYDMLIYKVAQESGVKLV
jgi:hypothetical protein